jgi:hypothetical protein
MIEAKLLDACVTSEKERKKEREHAAAKDKYG